MKDTIKNDELVVLKQDKQGRVRTPLARREQLLDEFEQSGLSGPKFAALTGLKYQTFATWVQKRKRRRGADGTTKVPTVTKQVNWLEAVMDQAQGAVVKPSGSVLMLHLPGGTRMEVGDLKQVELAVALLRAWQQPC
jgi:hypothetical protein